MFSLIDFIDLNILMYHYKKQVSKGKYPVDDHVIITDNKINKTNDMSLDQGEGILDMIKYNEINGPLNVPKDYEKEIGMLITLTKDINNNDDE